MRVVIILSLICGISCSHAVKNKDQSEIVEPQPQPLASVDDKNCLATREYVTAIQYIRSEKDFAVNEVDARKVADEVSKNCSGSSSRFIKMTNLLVNAGIDSKTAIETGIRFSSGNDKDVDSFVTIFRYSFMKEYLDLDLLTSLKNARELSVDFAGDKAYAREDFQRLAEYCISSKNLDLPKPQCASLALRISKFGANNESPVSKKYIDLYEYIISSKGPHKPTNEALVLAEQVVSKGSFATENFIQAYKFGSSSKGLSLNENEALKFAIDMSHRSVKKMPVQ